MRILTTFFFLLINFCAHGQLYSTGLVFNDDNYKTAAIKPHLNSDTYSDLPVSVSLKKYCPKPGNQLQLNTSPSWATSWSAKTILEAQKNLWTDYDTITHNTFSPAFNYYHIREANDETCEAGVDLYSALDYLKSNGGKKYNEFLEFCPRSIPEDIVNSSPYEPISDFAKLFDFDHPDQFKINAVKKSLSENYPVVIGMYCPPSFYRASNFWQPNELASSEYPGHAVCVIGYDDEKYGGAFEIINSWGSRWGNNGFMWITYNDFVDFTKYAYEVFTIEKSKNNTYDFSGSVNIKLNSNESIDLEQLDNGIFKTAKPFTTGTYFRVYLRNKKPAFLYVFGLDESNAVYRIFPHQENISPALVYKTNEVTIPDEDNYIEIVGDPGNETLCILYSKESLDFNYLLYNLEKFPGAVSENLNALLEGKLISPADISWTDNRIEFNSKNQSKSTILIQIHIQHI